MSRRKRDDAKTHNHCSRDASNCPVAVRNIQARYFIATAHDATFMIIVQHPNNMHRRVVPSVELDRRRLAQSG